MDEIKKGDEVTDSPVGPGKVTGFSERGFPQVNEITVSWCRFKDGSTFDPYHVL